MSARIDDARQETGVDAPGHDRFRAGVAHAQDFRRDIRIGGVDIALVDDLGADGLEHRYIGCDRGGPIAAGVADDGDLLFLEYLDHIAVRGGADLLVGGRIAEAHRIFLRVGQTVDPAGMDLRHVGACEQGHDRKRLAGIERTEDDTDLLGVGELGCAVHGLGRFALGVADDQLNLPPADAAGCVDLLHRELGPAIDANAGR